MAVKRTIYVKPEDQELFERASKECNLSGLLASLLRQHLGDKQEDDGLARIQLPYNLSLLAFRGRQLWPPSEDETYQYGLPHDPFGDQQDATDTRVYLTAKGKALMYVAHHYEHGHTYKVYNTVRELLEQCNFLDDIVGHYLLREAGTPHVIELDV